MHGPNPFIAKLIHAVVDTDRIVARNFETGLANLKALSEGRTSGASSRT